MPTIGEMLAGAAKPAQPQPRQSPLAGVLPAVFSAGDRLKRMSPDMSDGDWLQSVLSGNGAVGSGVRGGGGADLYNSLGGGDAAAQQLRQLGIPGIRYLDGGSRGAGGGTSNFVVFPGNEGLLSILERNGVPVK